MAGFTFDRQSAARIADTVRGFEQLPLQERARPRRRGAAPLLPEVLIADEDIEHNTTGQAKLAESSSADYLLVTERDELRTVYNGRQKIWKGARLLAHPGAVRGTDPIWHVIDRWSATRVRGVATGEIQPGQTGTIDTITPIDGHFSGSSVSVFLPSAAEQIDAGKSVYAVLVYDSGSQQSRWEVDAAASADPDGSPSAIPYVFYREPRLVTIDSSIAEQYMISGESSAGTRMLAFDRQLGAETDFSHDITESSINTNGNFTCTTAGVYEITLCVRIQAMHTTEKASTPPDPPLSYTPKFQLSQVVTSGESEVISADYEIDTNLDPDGIWDSAIVGYLFSASQYTALFRTAAPFEAGESFYISASSGGLSGYGFRLWPVDGGLLIRQLGTSRTETDLGLV